MKKLVYIIHPLKGTGKTGEQIINMMQVSKICKDIVLNIPDVIPISPVNNFAYLNDNIHMEREKALELCRDLLKAVAMTCGEALVFGEYQYSEGCLKEIALANTLGMEIRHMPDQVQPEMIGKAV